MSTPASEAALGSYAVPSGVTPKAPGPVEESAEYREAMRQRRASLLRRAGLAGLYATADSRLGREAWERARRGMGTYLWGRCGRGKTWAAACAVRLAVEGGTSAKLVTAKRLLDSIREDFDGGWLERAERFGLLALDDLGAERPTEWAQETLTRLLDTRTAAGLPTIVTSNCALGQLAERWGGGLSGQRIASRLAGACERVEVTGPDLRLS